MERFVILSNFLENFGIPNLDSNNPDTGFLEIFGKTEKTQNAIFLRQEGRMVFLIAYCDKTKRAKRKNF